MSYAFHRRLREMQPLWLRVAYAVRDAWRGILAAARRYYVEDFMEWQDKRKKGNNQSGHKYAPCDKCDGTGIPSDKRNGGRP